MKNLKKILGTGLLAVSLMLANPHKTMAQDQGYVSDQEFYDDLQPYGTWVEDPGYGDVWIPDADANFRPYASRGHWVQTDYGSTWVSDYPWGWATFHYGRWHYDDYYGWEWVPGHEWAPAWVSWRHGGGYYGWAPLTPGISITLSFGGGYNVPDNYWVCAPERYINRPNIYNYYARPALVINIIHRTTVVRNTYVRNNRTYIIGPRPADIQRITHQRVQVYRINDAARPGAISIRSNTINIFRPQGKVVVGARPARVVNAVAYRQANPHAGIGAAGKGGAVYNHANAAKLAQAARSSKPDNKVVVVNPPANKPAAPAESKTKPAPKADVPAAKPAETAKPVTTGATPRHHKAGVMPAGQTAGAPQAKAEQPKPVQQQQATQPTTPQATPAAQPTRVKHQRAPKTAAPQPAQPQATPPQATPQAQSAPAAQSPAAPAAHKHQRAPKTAAPQPAQPQATPTPQPAAPQQQAPPQHAQQPAPQPAAQQAAQQQRQQAQQLKRQQAQQQRQQAAKDKKDAEQKPPM